MEMDTTYLVAVSVLARHSLFIKEAGLPYRKSLMLSCESHLLMKQKESTPRVHRRELKMECDLQ